MSERLSDEKIAKMLGFFQTSTDIWAPEIVLVLAELCELRARVVTLQEVNATLQEVNELNDKEWRAENARLRKSLTEID